MDLKLPKKRVLKVDASPLKRIIAFIVDLLLINLVIATPFRKILEPYVAGSFQQNLDMISNAGTTFYLAFFSIVVLAWLYLTLTQFYLKQTVGMMLFHLYVDGRVTFFRCLLRNIFIIPFFPFYLFWIVDPVYYLFKKLRFLEEMSQTKVIQFLEVKS